MIDRVIASGRKRTVRLVIAMRSIASVVVGASVSGLVFAGNAADNARSTLEQKLCTARTFEQVVQEARAAKLDYYIDREQRALTARQDFDQKNLVSSSVVIEVQFNGDKTVKTCKVRVLYTGP